MTNPIPEQGLSEERTYTDLRSANIDRQAAWCPDQVPDLSFRGNELAGETGEVCNVIKKLERERLGWRGSRDTVEHLAEELADVVICADLCAISAGIDLNAAVVAKFNATSEKVGLPHRLSLVTELQHRREAEAGIAWRIIDENTPRDGTRILLAKIVGHPDHETSLWWATVGHWSSKWNNWNDGIEPAGLVPPTHWLPISGHGIAASPPPPVSGVRVKADDRRVVWQIRARQALQDSKT